MERKRKNEAGGQKLKVKIIGTGSESKKSNKKVAGKTRNMQAEQRLKWRMEKRKQREELKLKPQKRQRILEKDHQRKRLKKEKMKAEEATQIEDMKKGKDKGRPSLVLSGQELGEIINIYFSKVEIVAEIHLENRDLECSEKSFQVNTRLIVTLTVLYCGFT